MVVNLRQYKSHLNKELTVHTHGVAEKTTALTTLKIAEISAIFHDLGKINPHFQDKFKFKNKSEGYSNHAYLSAYGFLSYCSKNGSFLKHQFGKDAEIVIKLIVGIIAHHHGNLPNYEVILNELECKNLINNYISKDYDLPYSVFIKHFEKYLGKLIPFNFLNHPKFQDEFIKIGISNINNPLKYFLETQFAFASLIQADKTDAGDLILEKDKQKVNVLCSVFNQKLTDYLQTLQADTELNILRTQIRIEATDKIKTLLETTQQRVFALTAPTGAGKTLMLLSLANEIIKQKGNYRIIYSIPFLSITEQVEKECLKIFGNEFISRIDSKSENAEFQKLQKEIETNPEKAKDLLTAKFIEDIFLSPFIITTFVRFFETLVSNINATLLKLPNFAKCIFLIDEIQSLPPRLYTFFVAYLSAFCDKFDAYCIVSTATMPYFKITDDDANRLFEHFKEPEELLSLNYFNHQLFNRYKIHQKHEKIDIEQLADMVIYENQSVLVILNTIDDTKDLYKRLSEIFDKTELVLLNTHFTPNDRKYKIEYAKLRLQYKKKIILISTQLIEAGVDIDFPVLYRDMAVIPSIVQAAGRCNRNGKSTSGKVVLFNLTNRDVIRAELIYRGKDSKLLEKTREFLIENQYWENSLFDVQKDFFSFLGTDLIFGEHVQKKPEAQINFVRDINLLAFETIGKFRLIDEDYYGEEFRFYIPKDKYDSSFDELLHLDEKFKQLLSVPKNEKDFKKIMAAKFAIEEQLKKMSNQIVQVRLKKDESRPLSRNSFGDLNLLDFRDYNSESGINLDAKNQIL